MELWQYVIGQVFIAGAVYGGIRVDIRALYRAVEEARLEAKRANERIDAVLMQGAGR